MTAQPPTDAAAELLRGLDAAQRHAVETPATPLVILAGAGSGKTRVLTRRIAYRVACGTAKAEAVLAVTFTRKAAAELRSRLRALGAESVTAGTFHSIAYATLRRWWAETDQTPPRQVIAGKARFVAALLERDTGRPAQRALLAEIAAEIEWAKVRMIPPDSYAALTPRRPLGVSHSQMSSIYERYEEAKRRKHALDFEDMLLALCRALESDPPLSAELRARHRHVFVDEFQDVNPLQFSLLEAILGDSEDLCVVGDDRQAIYSFTGADPGYLLALDKRYERAEVVALGRSYRSTPEILALANALEAAAPTATSATGVAALEAVRPSGPPPVIRAHATAADEASWIARSIRDSRAPGASWGRYAVLFRTTAQSALIERALAGLKVPYALRHAALFLERDEVRDALGRLRSVPLPAGLPFAAAVEEVTLADSEGLPDEACENLQALAGLAAEYAATSRSPGVDEFTVYLKHSMGGEAAAVSPSAGVNLLTLHASKGLEFDSVWIAGIERGLLPIHHAASRDEIAEERRLLYVGMTRAKQRLALSWAERRAFGATAVSREPSEFLAPLEAALRDAAQAEKTSVDWAGELRTERERLRAKKAVG